MHGIARSETQFFSIWLLMSDSSRLGWTTTLPLLPARWATQPSHNPLKKRALVNYWALVINENRSPSNIHLNAVPISQGISQEIFIAFKVDIYYVQSLYLLWQMSQTGAVLFAAHPSIKKRHFVSVSKAAGTNGIMQIMEKEMNKIRETWSFSNSGQIASNSIEGWAAKAALGL